jgi:ribosomal protein S18 acetylase RimI-like enzyme
VSSSSLRDSRVFVMTQDVAPELLRAYDDGLQIIAFQPKYRDEFKRLNLAWLKRYFRVEPIDEQVLSHPEREILAGGGEILFARLQEVIVGTVALKAEQDSDFELTKMAVDEAWQGRGFGKRLLEIACERAKVLGAARVILYSQRTLRAAITMYAKYGFIEVPLADSRYARCDVKMQKAL